MANKGAKKRKEENEKHLQILRYVILGCNLVYLIVRLGIFYSSFRWKHWVGLAFTSGLYYFTYNQLSGMAKPAFGENGELLDGGSDMNLGGLTGYLHDVLYITALVQVLSIVSDYVWYIYLVIPAFALYKLWQLVLHPFIFQGSSEAGEEDAKARKRREKLEKKAQRPKFVRR